MKTDGQTRPGSRRSAGKKAFLFTAALLLAVCPAILSGCGNGGNRLVAERNVSFADFRQETAAVTESAAAPETTTEPETETTTEAETTTIPESTASVNAESRDYVVNTNTRKFHLPSCSSVGQIKSKNRSDRTCARDDLLSEGFVPCKRCNP
jgi:DNA-entry nuclease